MTYPSEVLADSPTIYWRLGEASGTAAADTSGNSHPGTYTNGVTLGATGLQTSDANNAMSVDASLDQYVVQDDTIGPVAFSSVALEVLWKPTAAALSTYLTDSICGFTDGLTPGDTLLLATDGSGHAACYGNDPVAVTSFNIQGTTVLQAGTIYHLAMRWDGSTVELLVDGVVEASAAFTDTIQFTGAQKFTVGSDLLGDPVDGDLDEAAFYETAPSAARFAAHVAAMAPSGSQNINANLLNAAPTFFSPSVTTGSTNVAMLLLNATPTMRSHVVFRAGEITAPVLNAAPTFSLPGAGVTVGQATTPTGAAAPAFMLERRTISGGGAAVLASAQPEEIVWTLNAPTELTFSFPKSAYAESQIPTLANTTDVYEYLAYYDDNLLAKGLMIQPDASGDGGAVTCHCADRLWAMNKRNIDAPRDNLLTNPDFEGAFSGWTQVGSFTATADTTRKVLGTHSAKFEDVNTDADDYIYQRFTPAPNGVGTVLTVSGWFFIAQITNPALGSRGLFVQVSKGGVLKDYNYFPVDPATATGVWQRCEFTIFIPPNATWDVEVRAYAICGTIFWDGLQCVAMDSVGSTSITGSATSEADIADIAKVLVSHIQSSANGKSNLFVGRNCPTNGVKLFRQYQYADHVAFADAIAEFVGRDDGFDISVEITPNTSTFTTHTPKKGTDRSGTVTLTYGGNVANYRYSRSGAGTITRATMMGQGSGPDRDEGEYADTSQLSGLVLQETRQAPPEAVLNSLLPLSRERVGKRRVPPLVLELDLRPDAGLINTLKVGDRVGVSVNDGYVQAGGTHRIVQMKLTCRTRVLTVFLNEET